MGAGGDPLGTSARHIRIQEHLSNLLRRRWSKRFGLAVSGGVDSMALAYLCSTSQLGTAFTGFIVDHGLRPESSDEAARVAEELKRLKVEEARILKLDWTTHGDPKTLANLETVARKLRYQALGKACYQERIPSMLVAHHADDQAETLAVRILSGYTGSGLRGIKDEVRFPDCEGVYGVDGSGWHQRSELQRPAIEKGKLRILRPLLPFSKDELISICKANDVHWFEDSTNTDKSLTLRNTVRSLLKSDAFPIALRSRRLVECSIAVRKQEASVETAVQDMLGRTRITLDTKIGRTTVSIDQAEATIPSGNNPHNRDVRAHFVRRLIQLTSPQTEISLQTLDKAVDMILPGETHAAHRESEIRELQVASVSIRRDNSIEQGPRRFSIRRQIPTRLQKDLTLPFPFPADCDQTLTQGPCWSDWLLWDSRYWIRVFCDGPRTGESMGVSFLTPDRLALARKDLDSQQRAELDQLLGHARRHGSEWTIPVITMQKADKDDVLALPTFRWQHAKCVNSTLGSANFAYDVSYKEVDFEETQIHRIVSNVSQLKS